MRRSHVRPRMPQNHQWKAWAGLQPAGGKGARPKVSGESIGAARLRWLVSRVPISRRSPTPGHHSQDLPLTLVEAGTRLFGSPCPVTAHHDTPRTRHLCIILNPGQRTLNLSEGDTTNVHKRLAWIAPIPRSPDPPPSGVLNGKTPQAAGFCFVDKLRRLTGPLAGLAQVQEPRSTGREAGGGGGLGRRGW